MLERNHERVIEALLTCTDLKEAQRLEAIEGRREAANMAGRAIADRDAAVNLKKEAYAQIEHRNIEIAKLAEQLAAQVDRNNKLVARLEAAELEIHALKKRKR